MITVAVLQTDWNDGKVLVALVESLGGVIVGGVEHGTGVDILQRGEPQTRDLPCQGQVQRIQIISLIKFTDKLIKSL